ncbi:MAG: hypothetical protein Q8936_14255 [Bacillota bacterium]|nr:hypothetical protein [Bacillota bacterium]
MSQNFRRSILESFNPKSLSPMLMLDADNLLASGTANNPANGTNVTAWNDLSGNNNNFTSASPPTYSVNAMNGHNVVTLVGASSQFMTCANNASNQYSANTNVSIFMIASLNNNPTTNNQILTKGQAGVGWGFGLQGAAANQIEYTNFGVVQYESSNEWSGSNTFDIVTSLYISGTGTTIYKNGANPDAIAGGGSNAFNGAMLIGQFSTGVYYWTGSINFIWVKYASLTAAQIALMHGWCKSRLGI